MTVGVAGHVKDKADEVKQQIYGGTEALQTKAGEVASQVKDAADRIGEKVPPSVGARVEPLMATVRQRPLPAVAVAVGVLVVLWLVLRRLLGSTS